MNKSEDLRKRPSDLAGEIKWDELISALIVGRRADGHIYIHGAGLTGGEGVYLASFLSHFLMTKEVSSATKER